MTEYMRRKIYECQNVGCSKHCTVRTASTTKPERCLYWSDFPNWVRIDKHSQKNMEDFE